jgi:hypothetical protein
MGAGSGLKRYCRMRRKNKKFDSVQMMRRLRHEMSEEMASMSPQERILYIQRKAAASPLVALFSPNKRAHGGEQSHSSAPRQQDA